MTECGASGDGNLVPGLRLRRVRVLPETQGEGLVGALLCEALEMVLGPVRAPEQVLVLKS